MLIENHIKKAMTSLAREYIELSKKWLNMANNYLEMAKVIDPVYCTKKAKLCRLKSDKYYKLAKALIYNNDP